MTDVTTDAAETVYELLDRYKDSIRLWVRQDAIGMGMSDAKAEKISRDCVTNINQALSKFYGQALAQHKEQTANG